VRYAPPPRTSTSHPPQQQDAVHSELRPGTGKGASAGAGPPRSATRQSAGPVRVLPPPPPAPRPQPYTPRSPPTTTGWRKGGCPVVSNRPLHRVMHQRCHHASVSARKPSWPPMPRLRLQRAATARRELKVQLPICGTEFPLLDSSVPSFDDRIQRWLWRYHTRSVQCFAAVALTSCNLAHPACFRKALRTLFVHTERTVVFPFCTVNVMRSVRSSHLVLSSEISRPSSARVRLSLQLCCRE